MQIGITTLLARLKQSVASARVSPRLDDSDANTYALTLADRISRPS
jgi:hypothetical protein